MNHSLWGDNSRTAKSGYSIHKITQTKPWAYPEHGHKDFHEMVCAVAGSFTNTLNGKEITQSAGEIILVRDRDTHSLAGKNFTYINLMFQHDWIVRLEYYTQFSETIDSLMSPPDPPRAVIPLKQQPQYHAELNGLLANQDSINGRRLFASFLLAIISKRMAPPIAHEYPAHMPEWLRRAVIWMDEQRHNPPSLKNAVVQSGRCHEHFTREFTRYIGIAPSLYLTNMRIDQAAGMLITSNNKIIDICHQAGFENESYFYRVFSQLKKMTPLAYRKTHGPRSIQH